MKCFSWLFLTWLNLSPFVVYYESSDDLMPMKGWNCLKPECKGLTVWSVITSRVD